jgi:hypothetical protein
MIATERTNKRRTRTGTSGGDCLIDAFATAGLEKM